MINKAINLFIVETLLCVNFPDVMFGDSAASVTSPTVTTGRILNVMIRIDLLRLLLYTV